MCTVLLWCVILLLVVKAGLVFQVLELAAVEVLGSEFQMLCRHRGVGVQSDILVYQVRQVVADAGPRAVGWRVCGVGHGVLELETGEGGGVREPACRAVPGFGREDRVGGELRGS